MFELFLNCKFLQAFYGELLFYLELISEEKFTSRLNLSLKLHYWGHASAKVSRAHWHCRTSADFILLSTAFRLNERYSGKFFTNVAKTPPHLSTDIEKKTGEIAMASLFLWLILLKAFSSQLKIFVNLTFSQKVWPICLFWFTLSWAESAVSPAEKKWHFGFVVAKMSIF